jgi:polyisoprenoid-binding protein YceI
MIHPGIILSALFLTAAPAWSEPVTYTLDPTHSQAVFSWNHIGFSTTSGMMPGLEGTLTLDRDALQDSRISVTVPIAAMFTGDTARDDYILRSGNFFDPDAFAMASFTSTGVEVTGAATARVTGDLTLNGMSRTVVFQVRLNGETDNYPLPPFNGRAAVGFDATAQINRSDFGMGLFAPIIGDEVSLRISIEAMDMN